MRLSHNNFIKGKFKDINPEYLDSQMYEDAKNLISEFDGENGSLTPMKGVARFTFESSWRDTADPNIADDFHVIAVKEVPTENKIIYFLRADGTSAPPNGNYIDRDFILMIDSAGTIEIILAGFDLGFVTGYEYHIDWVVANDQQYIFWCDKGHTAPKYLNVADAIADFTNVIKAGGTVAADDFETFINVVKKAPALAPTIEYFSDLTLTHNSLFGKFFKVKYRYHYKDGSVSAFSSESKIDTQSNGIIAGVQTLNELVTNEIDFLNSSKITYNTEYDVISIDIAFQDNDLLGWGFVNIIDLSGEYIFRNDIVLTPLGLTALDIKYYDNVPLTALSQTYIESVLSYGGYTDGFDNVPIDSLIQGNYTKDYAKISRLVAAPNDVNGQIARYYVDITPANVFTQIPFGSYYLISDFISTIWISPEVITAKYYLQLKIKREISDDTEFLNFVIEQIEKYGYTTNIPTGSTSTYGFKAFLDSGNGNRLTIDCVIDGVVIDDAGMGWGTNFSSIHHGSQAPQVPSLKNGSEADVGIVYYDQFHRQGAVNDAGSAPIVELFQQGNNEDRDFGAVGLRISLINTPPLWARSYQIVYSDKNTPANFFINLIGHTQIDSKEYIVLSTTLDHDYVMLNFADSVLVLHYQVIGSDTKPTFPLESREVKIIDISNTTGSLLAEISFDDYEYLASIAPNNTINNSFAEVRTNTKKNTPIYNEIGETFDIINPGAADRFHGGNVKDQEAADVSFGLIGFSNINILPDVQGGLNRAFIHDASLEALPNGTPIIVENNTTSERFKGFIYYHVGNNLTFYVEMEQQFVGGDDYLFWESAGSGSIISLGTVYLTEGRLIGEVDNFDYYYKWGTVQSVIQTYFPIPFNTVKSDDEVPLISYDDSNNLGRVQIESTNFQEVYRFASLIGSQVLQADTYFFGLTSFPNTSFPFKDLDPVYGEITALVTRDTDIVVFQETRCGRVLINKDILTTASGDQSVTVSDNVFGQYVPYMGNTGIGKTFQSLQYYKGRILFRDKVSGGIYRLSTDGLTEISDLGMKDYFNKITSDPNFSAINPNREEYLIQTETVNVEAFSIMQNHWLPSIEIEPQKMSRFKDTVVSFIGLHVLIHEQTANYNELFDNLGELATVLPSVSLSINDKKSFTKIYETLEFAGEALGLLQVKSIQTKDATSADILLINLLESSWIAQFKNGVYVDTLGTEFVGLGNLSAVGFDTANFDFDLNTLGFSVGDDLVYFDQSSIIFEGIITAIEARKITIDREISGGQNLYLVRKNASVTGSDLRGLYLRMRLEIPSVGLFFRLNSVSAFGSVSELHEK